MYQGTFPRCYLVRYCAMRSQLCESVGMPMLKWGKDRRGIDCKIASSRLPSGRMPDIISNVDEYSVGRTPASAACKGRAPGAVPAWYCTTPHRMFQFLLNRKYSSASTVYYIHTLYNHKTNYQLRLTGPTVQLSDKSLIHLPHLKICCLFLSM